MSCFGRKKKLTRKDISLPTDARTMNQETKEWTNLAPASRKELGMGARPVATRDDVLKGVDKIDMKREMPYAALNMPEEDLPVGSDGGKVDRYKYFEFMKRMQEGQAKTEQDPDYPQKKLKEMQRPAHVKIEERFRKEAEISTRQRSLNPIIKPIIWTPEIAREKIKEDIKLLTPPYVEPADPSKTYPPPPYSTWNDFMKRPVHDLDYKSFKQFLPSQKGAFVMFYDPRDYGSKTMALALFVGATFGDRHKGVYAAVDCTKNHHLCLDENIPKVPYLKLYSYGNLVNSYGERELRKGEELEKLIADLPVLEQVPRPDRPCELAAAADAKKKPGTPGAQKKAAPASPNKK